MTVILTFAGIISKHEPRRSIIQIDVHCNRSFKKTLKDSVNCSLTFTEYTESKILASFLFEIVK